MNDHDRQQLEGWAQALREELAGINPDFPWNRQRIQDRKEELARIELRLAKDSAAHAAFLARRAELVARYSDFARQGGGR